MLDLRRKGFGDINARFLVSLQDNMDSLNDRFDRDLNNLIF